MLELSEITENGNALVHIDTLKQEQKRVVLALIVASMKEEWDIPFWDFDEWILRVVNNVQWMFITVFAPKDTFGRSCLWNELVLSTQEF